MKNKYLRMKTMLGNKWKNSGNSLAADLKLMSEGCGRTKALNEWNEMELLELPTKNAMNKKKAKIKNTVKM